MTNLTMLIALATGVTALVETLKRFIDYAGLFADSQDLRKVFLFTVAIVGGLVVSFTTVNADSFVRGTFLTGLDENVLKTITGLIIGYVSIYPHRAQQILSMLAKRTTLIEIEGVVIDETESTDKNKS